MSPLHCTLLVDDDPTTNYLNRKLLEKLRVTDQVMVALNGQEALEMLTLYCRQPTPNCPALIFLDLNMPLLDGFGFLAAYQELPLAERQAIVVIMLTTSVHPRDLERLQELPAAGLLTKPLNSAKISQVLQDHFGWQHPLPE
ncbi:response regulator [Hymenobacter psychrotolerans]|uniref:CheY chemotaxis protein or a CheY-like REC (Receiver) domain n=1 Tax=Hymenobacter psychrotolerans DSM 18569 TaxID=1121959 RepID=A0A1M7BNI1_9BACT|nr:response regulator [Hymenobacter psychrotolerans]SHL56119.1 CheY chemotaxis protein or a CheY-like REC (receiver) domain [Hymenobacter psychrotolerans DSM 18569]